jgi:very-short-patch-repair endonuclease
MRRAGLTPTPQLRVYDAWGVFVGRLDFAWEDCKLGAEYQGDHHRTDRGQWLRDASRTADFASCGWSILPITSDDVFRRPAEFVRRTWAAVDARRRELAARSR